jgi:hypothetical protein
VRQKAAEALAKLVVIHTKVDPLVTELHTGIKAAEADAKVNYLKALQSVLKIGGPTLSEPVLKALEPTLLSLFADANGSPLIYFTFFMKTFLTKKNTTKNELLDLVRISSSGCVSAYVSCLKEGDFTAFVKYVKVSFWFFFTLKILFYFDIFFFFSFNAKQRPASDFG